MKMPIAPEVEQVNRRTSLRMIAWSTIAVTIGACDRQQPPPTGESAPSTPGGSAAQSSLPKKLRVAADVGVIIGEQLIKLKHPAARILGVVVILASEATTLVIDYLDLADARQADQISLPHAEGLALQNVGTLTFQREDGTQWQRRIDLKRPA
jgi:hypothetical protein